MSTLEKFNRLLNNLVHNISRIYNRLGHGYQAAVLPGLHSEPSALSHDDESHDSQDDDLHSLFGPFVWYTPPKKYRSLEKRLTRRFRHEAMQKYARPKEEIKMCLECGHWHEARSLCGYCYKKVKQETKEQMAKMGDDLEHNPLTQEVMVVYKDDYIRPKDKHGKYIVEMKKRKPQWFADKLASRVDQ